MMDQRLWNGEGVLGALRDVWEYSVWAISNQGKVEC